MDGTDGHDDDPVRTAYLRVARVMQEEAARLVEYDRAVAEALTRGADRLRAAAADRRAEAA